MQVEFERRDEQLFPHGDAASWAVSCFTAKADFENANGALRLRPPQALAPCNRLKHAKVHFLVAAMPCLVSVLPHHDGLELLVVAATNPRQRVGAGTMIGVRQGLVVMQEGC